jgi:hypothetical protein
MKTYRLTTNSNNDLHEAQNQARKLIKHRDQDISLVAWFDSQRQTGGPMEVCAEEPEKCVSDYATSCSADYKVTVNDQRFQFYYAITASDVATLDQAAVLRSHRDLTFGQYDNVQGG